MRLAFLTGALATGLTVAALTALVIWVITLVARSGDAWAAAPWVVSILAALAAVGTYAAEVFAERATQRRKRETGEPWAFRE
jgi:hypothetical protein